MLTRFVHIQQDLNASMFGPLIKAPSPTKMTFCSPWKVENFLMLSLNQLYIIIANHTSLLDTFIYPLILPNNTIYVAKKEIQKNIFISKSIKKRYCFFIDRKRPVESLLKLNHFLEINKNNQPLFLHPQGTRDDHGNTPSKRGFQLLKKYSGRKVLKLESSSQDNLWLKGQLFPRPGSISKNIIENP